MKESLLIKTLQISLTNKRVFVLGTLAFLTATTAQWSLKSLQKTPTAEYLCGTFVNIKSIRVDFSVHLRFGRVGESTG